MTQPRPAAPNDAVRPGRVVFIQMPGAPAPSIETLCAGQFPAGRSLLRLPLERAVAEPAAWDPAACDFVSGRLPLALVGPAPGDRVVSVIRPPRQMLAHWLKGDAPPVLAQFLAQGLRYDLFREFFSPGFDAQRLAIDGRYGIGLHAGAYADGCSVDEALQAMQRVDVAMDGTRMADEVRRLFITLRLQPPLYLPAPPAWPELPPSPEVDALVSEFDERFYRGAQERFACVGGTDHAAYCDYIARFAGERGLRLAPRQTRAWPLQGWLGNGWFDAEPTPGGGHFRWSHEAPPSLELPLAEGGWYSVRLYLQTHGIADLTATLETLGTGRRIPMSGMSQGNTLTLDAHARLGAADWLVVHFEHGSVPAREGSDPRRRGFVLGDVLVRRLT